MSLFTASADYRSPRFPAFSIIGNQRLNSYGWKYFFTTEKGAVVGHIDAVFITNCPFKNPPSLGCALEAPDWLITVAMTSPLQTL